MLSTYKNIQNQTDLWFGTQPQRFFKRSIYNLLTDGMKCSYIETNGDNVTDL